MRDSGNGETGDRVCVTAGSSFSQAVTPIEAKLEKPTSFDA